jgi:hypothetical protein
MNEAEIVGETFPDFHAEPQAERSGIKRINQQMTAGTQSM